MAQEDEYKFAPEELEFRWGEASRDHILNEIRRQEPNRLAPMSKITHIVFVPNYLQDRRREIAQAAEPGQPSKRREQRKDDRKQISDVDLLKTFRLNERLKGANPKVDTFMSDDRCQQFIQYVPDPAESDAHFRMTLRRTDEADFVSYTFYLEDLHGEKVDIRPSDSIALAQSAARLTPFQREPWLTQFTDPQYLSNLEHAAGSVAKLNPFDATVTSLLPDYSTQKTALEPNMLLLLGADYYIVPGPWFFQAGLLRTTLAKSTCPAADRSVLSALGFTGEADISAGAFRRLEFREFLDTNAGRAAFADLVMRLAKATLRGAFARETRDEAGHITHAYPFFASQVMDEAGFLISDLRPHKPHDFARVLILDFGLNSFSRGRLIQSCTDIGTYRILALQEIFAARAVYENLDTISTALGNAIDGYYTSAQKSLANKEPVRALRGQMTAIVDQLSELSQTNRATVHGVPESARRTESYVAVVDDGVRQLRESTIFGHQHLREFLDRRFKRAVRDVDRMASRYERIRRRVDEALGLVRTVLEVRDREIHLREERRTWNVRLLITLLLSGVPFIVSHYYEDLVGLISWWGPINVDAVKSAVPLDRVITALTILWGAAVLFFSVRAAFPRTR